MPGTHGLGSRATRRLVLTTLVGLLAAACAGLTPPPPGPPGSAGASATATGPSPSPDPDCGSLQRRIDAAPAGSVVDLSGCSFAAGASVAKPLTITGGTIRARAGSVGLAVTAGRVSIVDVTIVGPQAGAGRGALTYVEDESGVRIAGEPDAPLADVTVRGSRISGFGNAGIRADWTTGLAIEDDVVEDCAYGGIMVVSGSAGRVTGNTVARIGYPLPGDPRDVNENNAYGIALTDQGGTPTTDVTVDGNLVTDVATWHALDTHGGHRLRFTGNTVRGSSRGLFITGSPGSQATDITITGNDFESPSPVTFNLQAVTLVEAVDVTVTGNTATGWGDRVFDDYGSGSVGLTVEDNRPASDWPTIP